MSTSGPLHRRLFGALSLQGLSILVTTFQELLLVPVFLWGWGAELYRDWLVVLAAAEFLALLDFGLQTYFSNLLMARASKGDFEGYREAKGFAFSAYLLLVGGGVLLLGLLAAVASPEEVRTALGVSAGESRALLLVLGLWVVLRLPLGLFTGIYRARGEPARAVAYDLLTTCGRIAAIAVPILLGQGPGAVAAALIAATLIVGAAAATDQRRRYAERWPAPRLPRRGELWAAVTTGLLYNLNALAVVALVQGMVLVLSHLASGPLAVVLFTTARTITGLARQVTVQLAVVVGVEQSREHGGGRHENLLRLHHFTLRLAGAVVGGLGGLILVLGDDLLTLWTRGDVPYYPELFVVLLGVAMFGAPTRAAAQLLFFTNRPATLAVSHAVAAAVALPLALILVPAQGVVGAAFALLAGELLAVTLGLGRVLARIVGEAWSHQFRASALPVVVSFGLGSGSAWLLHHAFGAPEWGRLIALMALWTGMMALPALYLVLPADLRTGLLRRLAGAGGERSDEPGPP